LEPRAVMDLHEFFKRDYVQTALMIIVAILAVLIFWYGLSFFLGTENPVLAVASESMEPVLYKGDLILIEGVKDPADIYAAPKDASPPGDIIIFYRFDERIVHRAVEKTLNDDGTYSFTTWGDNNIWPDGRPVQQSDIVGKYLGKLPWLGHIALFFADTEVKVAFIALWIIILVIVELAPSIRRKLKGNEVEESLY